MFDFMKDFVRYEAAKRMLKHAEPCLTPMMLLSGVALDVFTFRTIQIRTSFLLLCIYLVIAATTITYLHCSKVRTQVHLIAPFLLQFTFGALLSSSLIFYWFSGAFSVSWPVLLVVAFLMISNEKFRSLFARPTMQLVVLYFTFFSFGTLLLPYVFNSIAPQVFVLAGILTLFIFLGYLRLLMLWAPHLDSIRTQVGCWVLVLFVAMNVLYVKNVIPPLPLSLREAGVYHRLERVGGAYRLFGEEESWISRMLPGQDIQLLSSESAVVFSSVFAPTDLRTTIVHHWYFYDTNIREWISRDHLSFAIAGGRNAGYRGYSRKRDLLEGEWRVDVETPRGQVLGRIRFNVKRVVESPMLVETVK